MLDEPETKRRRAAVNRQATKLVMINGGGKVKLADDTLLVHCAPRSTTDNRLGRRYSGHGWEFDWQSHLAIQNYKCGEWH